jgi:hypothetical protein
VLAVSATEAEKYLFRVQTKREMVMNIKRKTVPDELECMRKEVAVAYNLYPSSNSRYY